MAIGHTNLTSSAAVKAGPGYVCDAILAAGSDTATLILYDNTAGSGTIILKLSAVANTTASANLADWSFSNCYASLTGTGPSASIGYV